MKRISAVALASAVAGALALAATPALAQMGAGSFKCWGVAKKGQNDCANATKTHSCAGESKVDYDLGEWKGVKDAAACKAMGGSDKPGKGVNKEVKATN